MTVKDYIRQLKLAHDPYIAIYGVWGSGILEGYFSALRREDFINPLHIPEPSFRFQSYH